MKYIVFDIETQNTFADVNSNEPKDLDISVVSIYNSVDQTYKSFTIDELDNLWPIIERTEVLIGFNSDHFDIPLLNKYYQGNLEHFKSIDLMKSFRDSFGKRVKLDEIAKATLGIAKSGHGLEAIAWWKNGEIEKIKKYCEDDVKITKELFEYARDNKHLKVKNWSGKIVEVPIDTSSWESKDFIVPQSLPF